jgi:hypothetical protein
MDLVFNKVDEVEVPYCEVGLTAESPGDYWRKIDRSADASQGLAKS